MQKALDEKLSQAQNGAKAFTAEKEKQREELAKLSRSRLEAIDERETLSRLIEHHSSIKRRRVPIN